MSELRLSEIWVYPVKSLAGVRVGAAHVVPRGLEGDRRYMVVDAHGRFVTQREQPSLAAVHAELTDDGLVLTAPGGRAAARRGGPSQSVTVWGEPVEALDAGGEASALLSEHVGVPLTLVYMPESTRRPADQEHARPDDVVSFADGFPFLLTTTASLAALNDRLREPVDMRRFRPNLVVAGAQPFAEDEWAEVSIDSIRFRDPKPCSRCAVVDVDPDEATPDRRVLAELGRFRRVGRHVNFGLNLLHDGAGRLEVGMPVTVSISSS